MQFERTEWVEGLGPGGDCETPRPEFFEKFSIMVHFLLPYIILQPGCNVLAVMSQFNCTLWCQICTALPLMCPVSLHNGCVASAVKPIMYVTYRKVHNILQHHQIKH